MADAGDQLAAQEAALVAEIAAGDVEEPTRELYRRYARRLYRFGTQVLGDTGLAEEMVQESFVRLWRTASRFIQSKRQPAKNCPGERLPKVLRQ